MEIIMIAPQNTGSMHKQDTGHMVLYQSSSAKQPNHPCDQVHLGRH